MHEFSIIQNIIEIAIDAAIQNRLETVSSVEVEVGQASGIVPEAMEFAWESARKNTLLRMAALSVKLIPLMMRCRGCGMQYFPGEIYEPCPGCGEINGEIISGKELKVTAIVK
jgi:hydrogenase nickel incorporation protein HypA/HybF